MPSFAGELAPDIVQKLDAAVTEVRALHEADVRAMVLIIGMVFLILNLGVDLSYRYLDPRIRL